MRPKPKILLLALAICLAFPFFFTETLVAAEIEHDCCPKEETKEETQDCLPCLHFLAAENLLKNLKQTAIISSSLVPILPVVQVSEDYSSYNFYHLSSVELKVRFNT